MNRTGENFSDVKSPKAKDLKFSNFERGYYLVAEEPVQGDTE